MSEKSTKSAAKRAAKAVVKRFRDRSSSKKVYTVSLTQENFELFQEHCPPRQASDTLDLLVRCYLEEIGAL